MSSARATTPLTTPRLLLRAYREEDAEAVGRLWRENADRFRDSFPGAVAQIQDAAGAREYLRGRAAAWVEGTGFWYGVWEQAGGLVGQVHLKHLDWDLRRAELAYLLAGDREGKGLATEAVGRVASMCFQELGLAKLVLRTIEGNARSEALALRLGFRLEGTLRREFLRAGTSPVDVRYFGLLAGEGPG